MNNIKTNVLFCAIIALIFAAYLVTWLVDPVEMIQWLGLRHNLSAEKMILLRQYINETAWLKGQILLGVLLLICVYLYYNDRGILKEYKMAVGSFFIALKRDLVKLSTQELWLLAIALFFYGLVLCFYSAYTPMQLDELHAWLFFICKGPLVIISYYPSSNNHIAFNLLSSFWNTFLPPLWSMRMVSMLSALCTLTIFYLILRRRYSRWLCLWAVVLLMSLSPFAWFSIQGRSYILELLGLMMMVYVLLNQKNDVVTDRMLVLLNVFVVYTITVALIPMALLNAYYAYRLLWENKSHYKRIVKTVIYSAVLVWLCYAPVIIFSGFLQLVYNPHAQKISSWSEALSVAFTDYLPGIWSYITGCDGILATGLLIVLGILSLAMYRAKERLFLIFIFILLIPAFLLPIYPYVIFERTWLWLMIPFICWVLEIVLFFTPSRSLSSCIFCGLLFLFLVSVNVRQLYKANVMLREHAQHFSQVKEYIHTHLQGKVIRVFEDAPYNYLMFDQKMGDNYQLLYQQEAPSVKADASLNARRGFKPSDGYILWEDQDEVLYIPK